MSEDNPKRPVPLVWLYLLSGLAILAILVWTSLRLLHETPNREASTNLPGRGWVTVVFTTWPYPPTPDVAVRLIFTARNDRGAGVDLGRALNYHYGKLGEDQAEGFGQARLDERAASYEAEAGFRSEGSYWLELELEGGQAVRFQFFVESAGG